jgi:hypothetical protein
VDLTATASATLMSGQVDGFQSIGSRVRILPMTYDVNSWTGYVSGSDTRDTSLTSTGERQVSVYPSIKATGNFGELSLDQGNDGASVISDWIDNGVQQTDLQAEYTTGLLPLSSHDPNGAPDWMGNPGLKNSTIQSVGAHVGDLYLLPLFKPVNPGDGNGNGYQAGTGQGSNFYYTIVQFVGVKITAVDSTGNNKSIKVMPSALIDPNLVVRSVTVAQPPPAGAAVSTTFVGARLVR